MERQLGTVASGLAHNREQVLTACFRARERPNIVNDKVLKRLTQSESDATEPASTSHWVYLSVDMFCTFLQNWQRRA